MGFPPIVLETGPWGAYTGQRAKSDWEDTTHTGGHTGDVSPGPETGASTRSRTVVVKESKRRDGQDVDGTTGKSKVFEGTRG